MYNWIILLSTWNWHDIVNQLYSNIKNFKKFYTYIINITQCFFFLSLLLFSPSSCFSSFFHLGQVPFICLTRASDPPNSQQISSCIHKVWSSWHSKIMIQLLSSEALKQNPQVSCWAWVRKNQPVSKQRSPDWVLGVHTMNTATAPWSLV